MVDVGADRLAAVLIDAVAERGEFGLAPGHGGHTVAPRSQPANEGGSQAGRRANNNSAPLRFEGAIDGWRSVHRLQTGEDTIDSNK